MFSRIITILKIIKHKDFKKKNRIKKTSDKVLIVGNGPSVSNVDLHMFIKKDVQLCCVNSFAGENKSFFDLRPKYYCAIDPDIYSKNPRVPEQIERINKALKKVDWDMYYICFRHQKLPFDNDNIHYCYLPISISDDIERCYPFFERSMASYGFQNVINACLYYFITAKAKKIMLVGIETDWHRELFVDKDNTVYRKKRHFYGEYNENVTATGLINKGELYKYFEFYSNTLKDFYLSSKYATKMNVNVVNFTMNSYVDCFEKKDINDYFKEIEIK